LLSAHGTDEDQPISLEVLRAYGLTLHGQVSVDSDSDGGPKEFHNVHRRYANVKNKQLAAFGAGPFCRLRVPGLQPAPGVYALSRDSLALYVGKSENLEARFGYRLYGAISPANCYAATRGSSGGQATCCKVNHLILREARAGLATSVWLITTDEAAHLEKTLIALLRPPWNGRIAWPPGREPFPKP
jgi:hypothetical protein